MEKDVPKVFKDISSAFEKFSVALKTAFTPKNNAINNDNKGAENEKKDTILTSLPLELQYHVFSQLKRHPDSNAAIKQPQKNTEGEQFTTVDDFWSNDLLKSTRNAHTKCTLCSIRASCKTYRDLILDFHHPSSNSLENRISYWEYNTSERNMFMNKAVKLKYILRVDPLKKEFHYVELHWDPSDENLNYSILYAGLINIERISVIDDGSLAYRVIGVGECKFENRILTLYSHSKPAGEFQLQNGELKFKTKSSIQPMAKKFYRSKPGLMYLPKGEPEDRREPIRSIMDIMDRVAEKHSVEPTQISAFLHNRRADTTIRFKSVEMTSRRTLARGTRRNERDRLFVPTLERAMKIAPC